RHGFRGRDCSGGGRRVTASARCACAFRPNGVGYLYTYFYLPLYVVWDNRADTESHIMQAQRHTADKRGSVFSLLSDTTDYLVQNMGLLFVLIAITIAWAFWGPVSIQPNSPPQALLILAALTIGTAFFVRATRQRFGLDTRISLTLPDPLYTLYLATIVLAGTTGAIVFALATPLIV